MIIVYLLAVLFIASATWFVCEKYAAFCEIEEIENVS
tara:strand:- start:353 stop:463 length:111 start_codon:yes stop_codon:yes gene_type:complete